MEATGNRFFYQVSMGHRSPCRQIKRRFDAAVYSRALNKVWLIETNYYGGGGSKLKAVAGEFTELSQFVKHQKIMLNLYG